MKYRIAICSALVLAVGALWLSLRGLLTTAPVESTGIIVVSENHAYQYVAAPSLSWNAARNAAAQRSWRGNPGYLATIDTAGEYQLILDRLFPKTYPDVTYLGGRQNTRGEWRWVAGPDGAEDGGKGRLFWSGDEQGIVQPGRYVNWMPTAFQHGGKWDVAKVCCVTIFSYLVPQFSTSLGTGDAEEHVEGYLVEYGD